MNILLTKFTTPFETVPFNEIKPEDFLPAVKEAIATAKGRVEALKKQQRHRDFRKCYRSSGKCRAGSRVDLRDLL